jgi:UDP-GlcNAc:undecaprenyl-phosphate GlcNAc-1-phosphate transferase
MCELAAYLFLISLLSMGILTPLAIRLGNRLRIVDTPGPRKLHQDPIPLVGGWAIFITLALVIWIHLIGALLIRGTYLEDYLGEHIRHYASISPSLIGKITPVFLGGFAIFLLGLADDIRGLSVRNRLFIQLAIAISLVLLGFRPSLSFLPYWVGGAVGVLWIVGITNAFNFLDGLDGLSSGVALVGALALLTIMGITSQPDVIFFLAAVSGTLLGFLKFNFHPAKLFLGSSGSLLIGYLMAMSTLQVTYMKGAVGSWLMPLLTPVFVLAIPLYDTCSVVLIRLIQKRSIAIGDQSHFHHRLMKLGFSHRQTVAFIVLLSFSIALSAVRLVQTDIFGALIILLQILGMMSLIIIAERVAAKVRNDLLAKARSTKTAELMRETTLTDQWSSSVSSEKNQTTN